MSESDGRWNTLSAPWQAAVEMAWEAYCESCIPIGAVVTDADGKILARGRNRIYQNAAPEYFRRGSELAHAETEALRQLDYDAIHANSCVLYATTEPCPMCLGTFYISGLRTLHYASRDPWGGSVDLLGKNWYLSLKPIKVYGPPDPVIELILMGLLIERDIVFKRVDPEQPNKYYSRWLLTAPNCLKVGQALHETGRLAQLLSQKASAAQMVEGLYDRVSLFV